MDADDTIPSIDWPLQRAIPSLDSDEVHLWCWDLCGDESKILHVLQILSEIERSRAERFVFPRDQRRYILAHAGMREILGLYLGVNANIIEFANNRFGKPRVGVALQFNLSHSGNLAVIGVAKEFEIGVDVELVRGRASELPVSQIAPEEQNELYSLPSESFVPAFYHYWTRKEALLKGLGIGFAGQVANHSIEGWRVENLTPAAGYTAAVAAKSNTLRVRCFRYSHNI
ncbi:MAG TPA: 4'-phosphopantetheinyl transferase superfamily protein [Pseudacidobacterium sp.]|nr:4'-phosphopantetheinyl transferase superfamily protein [Pseudacidobacterium sp.]